MTAHCGEDSSFADSAHTLGDEVSLGAMACTGAGEVNFDLHDPHSCQFVSCEVLEEAGV